MNEHLANLIYYNQFYVFVGFLIYIIWILYKTPIIRVLTTPIGVYYIFHLIINIIEIFNEPLKKEIYKIKYINYGLAITLALSLVIAALCSKYFRKSIIKKINKLTINHKKQYKNEIHG